MAALLPRSSPARSAAPLLVACPLHRTSACHLPSPFHYRCHRGFTHCRSAAASAPPRPANSIAVVVGGSRDDAPRIRHRYRDPRATARVKRGNEMQAPRLLPCACPSSPRTGHALVAPHAVAVPADQGQCSHLTIARRLDEIWGQSIYHLMTSLGEEREEISISATSEK